MIKAAIFRWASGLVLATVLMVSQGTAPAWATASPPAKGLSSGVHIDPGSPAAKEYQIPLGAARGNGLATASGPNTLFGAGITPSATTPSANTDQSQIPPSTSTGTTGSTGTAGADKKTSVHKHRGRRHHAHHKKHHAALAGGSSGPAAPSPQRVIGTASSGGTGITWMLGAAVLVLLLGGLGGSVLARHERRTSPRPS